VAAVVLDCSVTLSWFMPDEGGSDAHGLRTLVTDNGAVVPMLWPIEIGNVFLSATRARRVSLAQRQAAIDSLAKLPIEIDGETLVRALTDTLALGDRFRLSLYDACYLELALRRELPLATLDKDLSNAGRKAGVSIMS
jgi:predicted nucleic acid-binding protein